MALTIAEQYVEAFGKLAKDTNTVILPANMSEPSSMVTQALAVYESIKNKKTQVWSLLSFSVLFKPVMQR